MNKTFQEVIAGIRTAIYGREVREDIAQGMEYVETFAATATQKASAAADSADAAKTAQTTSKASENASAASAKAAKTSETASVSAQAAAANSASAAKASEQAAAKSAAEAGAKASTDKTLSIADAPADAAAAGTALRQRYTKGETDARFLPLTGGTMTGPLILNDGGMAVGIQENAGAHNSIYRGKNLGTKVTEAQWAEIKAGTFRDLFIGDYWTINWVNWRIAAFDYYYNAGNPVCTVHHVVVLPDENMYAYVMNDTNTTEGGYAGSKMHKEGLNQAKNAINAAFGESHILKHRQYLCNAVTSGKPSGGAWYDSTVELMTEQNVYGSRIFGVGNSGESVPDLKTIDKIQFPLFALRPDMIPSTPAVWTRLRDVVSSTSFAYTTVGGVATYSPASALVGVRPSFSIVG